VGIITLLKKLISWLANAAAALAKTSKKAYKGIGNIRPAIKEDFSEKALGTKEGFLNARRKTIALFRRPLNDVSHIGIIVVVLVALLTGVSAMLGTTEEIAINPFMQTQTSAKKYLSSTEKRVMQADSVTTVAYYIDQVKLGPDAAAATEQLNTQINVGYGGSEYLASVPIVQNTSTSIGNKVTDYVVLGGDTLSTIAAQFNVSTDTIRYANAIEDIDSITPGDTLVIPPVTGVLHTVVANETTASIAKRYGANEAMLISQNALYGEDITVGMKLMVPDGQIPEAPKPKPTQTATGSTKSGGYGSSSYIARTGSFRLPTLVNSGNPCGIGVGYYGWHSYSSPVWRAFDLCNSYGTPIYAADSGKVVEANWNGGYGNTILIDHGDGFSSRYAHMNSFAVYGGYVSKGQVIGYMGSTGYSSAPHLHFEIYFNGSTQYLGNYF
jgi:murein DD-endopeptidase MepM/ murein hydrolase activator NlpD